MRNKIIASLLFIFVAVSCTSNAITTDLSRTNIREVVQDSESVLVDVRIPSDYEKGTAHHVVNIPLAKIESNIEFFKNEKNIVVFCNSGRQSKLAVEKLHKLGIEHVYDGVTWKNVKAIQEH